MITPEQLEEVSSNVLKKKMTRKLAIFIITLAPLALADLVGKGLEPSFAFNQNVKMWVPKDYERNPLREYVSPCLDLASTITKEEDPEVEYQLFPRTKYGPLVNAGFSGGKDRCHYLDKSGYFIAFKGEFMTYYNPYSQLVEARDPFSNKLLGFLDLQRNLVELNSR